MTIKKAAWMNKEPKFNVMDYSSSLTSCLNFYNTEVDEDTKKDWVLDYWKSQNKPVLFFDRISSSYFVQLGALIRTLDRGFDLEPQHVKYIERKYEFCVAKANEIKDALKEKSKLPENVKVVKKTVEEKINDQVRETGSEIDGELDHIALNEKRKLDIKSIVRNNTLPQVGKLLSKMYEPQRDEIKSALLSLDADIKEGYKNFSKKTLRMMYDFLDDVVNATRQAKNLAKPRKKKEKPPSVLAAKVKYMKEFLELQMRSITPDKIVGAETVYLFNTKIRKLFKYVAVENTTLTIKGSTLQNFDTTKSCSKTIRKPEQFFQGVNDMTKRPIGKKFDDIKGVAAQAPGRINQDMIILKVFH